MSMKITNGIHLSACNNLHEISVYVAVFITYDVWFSKCWASWR